VVDTRTKIEKIAEIHHQIKRVWEPVLDAILAETKPKLIAFYKEKAAKVTSGNGAVEVSLVAPGGLYDVKYQDPKSKLPQFEKLVSLLNKKGVDWHDACDETITYDVSADKIKALIDAKKVTEAEIDACRKSLGEKILIDKL